jgi:hypothetical protein
MLKRRDGDRFRLVTQPDHAALSGYLAAHWRNADFARLGDWDPSPDPEALWREIVFGITQHDNGWWEWEADPEIDAEDGLPLDFLQGSDEGGFARWRRGAARFEHGHPCASVLVNRHAYWLQAARVVEIREPQFRHPLFGFRQRRSEPDSEEAATLREFLIERLSHERGLLDRLAMKGPLWRHAIRDDTLLPAVRLLQVLDTISLALCGGARQPVTLLEVPRASWGDRVEMRMSPADKGCVAMSPYPFNADPLAVAFPAARAEAFAGPEKWIRTVVEIRLSSGD